MIEAPILSYPPASPPDEPQQDAGRPPQAAVRGRLAGQSSGRQALCLFLYNALTGIEERVRFVYDTFKDVLRC